MIYGTGYYGGPGYYGGGYGPGVGVGIGSVGVGLASIRAGNQSKPPLSVTHWSACCEPSQQAFSFSGLQYTTPLASARRIDPRCRPDAVGHV